MDVENNEIYDEVTQILISFKIPFGMSGFDYLRNAVLKCVEEEEYLNQVTNKLYPYLADKFETNQLHIERNIRSAIEKAYDLNGLLTLNEYCKQVVYKNEYKFTNSEMIVLVLEILKIKLYKKYYIKEKIEIAK